MPRRGAGSLAITRAVLEAYGTTCHLCKRPGATSRDHLIPYSFGGTDDLNNLRPAHVRCNSKRSNRALNGYGATIRVVMGPPAAGKSTYVRDQASLGDVVIDLDRIARALMPEGVDLPTHVYPEHVRHVAIGARRAAIDRACRLTGTGATVWIIHADPSPDDLELYRFLRYDLVTIDPGRDVVERRAAADRPPEFRRHVARWYARHATPAALASTSAATTSVAVPTPTTYW